jgi:hypothetical protein
VIVTRRGRARNRTFTSGCSWPGPANPLRLPFRLEKIEIMKALLSKSSLAIKVFKLSGIPIV